MEAGEQGASRLAQLLGDLRLYHLNGLGRDGILQFGEFGNEIWRQQIGTGRQDLPQLNERDSQLFKRKPQVFGLSIGSRAPSVPEQPPVEGHEMSHSKLVDQIAKAVPEENLHDLSIAVDRTVLEVFGSHACTPNG